MYMTAEQWLSLLSTLCEGTEYQAKLNGCKSSAGVVIVPRGCEGPQRIAVYPGKTKDPGLVIEQDVYKLVHIVTGLGEPTRIHSNRPHYRSVPEDTVMAVCKKFLGK